MLEIRLPAAPVGEGDVQMLGVQPEQCHACERLGCHSAFAFTSLRAHCFRPALANTMPETQPATVAQHKHRLGKGLVRLLQDECLTQKLRLGHDVPRSPRHASLSSRISPSSCKPDATIRISSKPAISSSIGY